MASATVSGVAVRGICSAVPEGVKGLDDLEKLVGADAENVAKLTGVRNRRCVRPGQTTSDLCHAAAEKLFKGLNWERDSVDALIFVSQTTDYLTPATACILQSRLGLPSGCAAFDVHLGCSGFVYGLWLAGSILLTGCRRALVLCGETSTRLVSPVDRAVYPLFGDAGTATALELAENSVIHFDLQTDGRGHQHLIIPAGGFRHPRNEQTCIRAPRESGCIRSDEEVYMNGEEIFAFTLREVPPLINRILDRAGWSKEEPDFFVLHQANKFILNHLAKKMTIPYAKVPIVLENFGNTSSASIPLALTHALGARLAKEKLRLVLAGFGVGLSWAAAALDAGPLTMPELEIVP